MDADAFLERVCADVRRHHEAHTILVYGSRADGSANDFSDYDIAAFAPVGVSLRDAREIDGQFLDLFIHPESVLIHPSEEHLMLRGSRIVAQRGHEATEFLGQLDAIFVRGPVPLADDEIQARRAWAWKMAARMERGDIEGAYRRSWLLTVLLEDYFHLRHRWYQGPKKSFQWLSENDTPTYLAFDVALRRAASHDAIHHLITCVVGANQRGEALP